MFDLRDLRGLVAPSLMAVVLTGCGGGGGEEGGAEEEGGAPAAEAIPFPVDEATAGGISGRVTFTGTAPANAPIDMAEEEACAAKHTAPPTEEKVVASGGGLANVFVYVKEGLDAALRFPAGEGAVLDQDGCQYVPHVIALSTGENLTIRNSDPVLHNINTGDAQVNRGFNRSQPQEGMTFDTSFPQPEVMIPVRCDVHGWMEAFIGVTAHPYHAVTGADGSFSLDRLPPGTYTLEAWHEVYGTSTQTVEVTTGGTADVTFAFDASMAGREVPLGPVLVINHEQGTAVRAQQ